MKRYWLPFVLCALVLATSLGVAPATVFAADPAEGTDAPDTQQPTEEPTEEPTEDEGWSLDSFDVSASTVELGESVVVTPVVTGADAASVEFNYVWRYGNGWGEWGSTEKESGADTPETSWKFTPAKAGTYTLYVDAVDADGKRECAEGVTLTVTATWDLEGVQLSTSKIDWGESVTFSPVVTGNTRGVTFNYVWQRGSSWSQWSSTVKETGSRTTATSQELTPVGPDTYTLYIDAVGTDGRTVTKSATLTVVKQYSFDDVQLSANAVTYGDSVTVTPVVTGDTSVVTYNYVWCYGDSWDEWSSTLKETGARTIDTSWEFTPTKWGTYHLYVDVCGPDGKTYESREATLTVDSGWKASAVNLSTSSTKVGQTCTVSLPVTGQRASKVVFNYVWQKNNWSSWGSTLKDTGDHTTDTSWGFVPKSSGNYTLYVDAYDTETGQYVSLSAGCSVEKAWKLEKLQITYSSSPLAPDSAVKWTAVVSGDTTGLQYNFVWSKNSWEAWNSTLRHNDAYTSSSSVTYNIGGPGLYDFYVDVVDANGEVEKAHVGSIWCYKEHTFIGVKHSTLLKFMEDHNNDNFWLGTRYVGIAGGLGENECSWSRGYPRSDGYAAMNCAGFPVNVYRYLGGNLNWIRSSNSYTPWSGGPGGGGACNAYRWYSYARASGVEMYTFTNVYEMLDSGMATKGDLVFYYPYSPYSDDCHLTFFWGDNPHDNWFWHQIAGAGNVQSPITNTSRYAVLIKGFSS